MISAACAELGERALICAGWNDFGDTPRPGHLKIVGAVNHAAIFPTCCAVVHHGGAGTTAASCAPESPRWCCPCWAISRFGVPRSND